MVEGRCIDGEDRGEGSGGMEAVEGRDDGHGGVDGWVVVSAYSDVWGHLGWVSLAGRVGPHWWNSLGPWENLYEPGEILYKPGKFVSLGKSLWPWGESLGDILSGLKERGIEKGYREDRWGRMRE